MVLAEFFNQYKKHDTQLPFFGESKLNPCCDHEYLNAWSSLSYCIVGGLILKNAKSPWLGIWGVYVFLLGIGSFLNHYFWKSLETKLFDTSSMLAVIAGLCYYIIEKRHTKYTRILGTLVTLTAATSLWLSICIEELEEHYITTFSLLVAAMVILIVYPKEYNNPDAQKGVILLLVGLGLWKIDLDYYKELGQYNIKIGDILIYPNFHVLWHIMTSMSLWYCYKSVKDL